MHNTDGPGTGATSRRLTPAGRVVIGGSIIAAAFLALCALIISGGWQQ